MSFFTNIKLNFAGWSVWVLVKKLAGRFIPIAATGVAVFFTKWAPDTVAEKSIDTVTVAVITLLWAGLESARNMFSYFLKRNKV